MFFNSNKVAGYQYFIGHLFKPNREEIENCKYTNIHDMSIVRTADEFSCSIESLLYMYVPLYFVNDWWAHILCNRKSILLDIGHARCGIEKIIETKENNVGSVWFSLKKIMDFFLWFKVKVEN